MLSTRASVTLELRIAWSAGCAALGLAPGVAENIRASLKKSLDPPREEVAVRAVTEVRIWLISQRRVSSWPRAENARGSAPGPRYDADRSQSYTRNCLRGTLIRRVSDSLLVPSCEGVEVVLQLRQLTWEVIPLRLGPAPIIDAAQSLLDRIVLRIALLAIVALRQQSD